MALRLAPDPPTSRSSGPARTWTLLGAAAPPREPGPADAPIEPADMNRPASQSLVGRIVYGYRVEAPIGSGSQGEIYLLTHPTLHDKHLALKVLRGESVASHELRSRFLQDAMAAAKVGSAGVVQPVQIDELPDGTPYIVMELAPGRSLDAELDSCGPLPVGVALRIAESIAATMVEVHRCGIIHRDLKPGNIMVDRDGEDVRAVKLLDFGVAQVSEDIRRVKTGKGRFFGTRFYIAPETSSGDVIDGRADVFSLGVVLFEMLTGETPFPDLFATLSPEAAPAASAKRPEGHDPVSPMVDRIIAGALAKHVQQRLTMEQLRIELSAAVARLPLLPSDAALPGDEPRRRTLRSMGVSAGGLAGIPQVAPDAEITRPGPNETAEELPPPPASPPSIPSAPEEGGGGARTEEMDVRDLMAAWPTAQLDRDQLRGESPRFEPPPPSTPGSIEAAARPTTDRGLGFPPASASPRPPASASPRPPASASPRPPDSASADPSPPASSSPPTPRGPATPGTTLILAPPSPEPPIGHPHPPATLPSQTVATDTARARLPGPGSGSRRLNRALALAGAAAGLVALGGIGGWLYLSRPARLGAPSSANTPTAAAPPAAAVAGGIAIPAVAGPTPDAATVAVEPASAIPRGSPPLADPGPAERPAGGWTLLDSATTEPLLDVWTDGKGAVVAVGGHATVVRSRDHGRTFERRDLNGAAALYGVWGDGQGLVVAVGEHGGIYTSSDGGGTWTRRHHDPARVLTGVWGSSRDDVYAVGNPAEILHSSDGGKSWQRQAPHTGNGLRRVWGRGAGEVFAVGWGGAILRREAKGWTPVASSSGATLFDLWGEGDDLYAVGARHPPGSRHRGPNDVLLRSSDGGRHWRSEPTEVRSPIYAVGGGAGAVFLGGPNAALFLRGAAGWQRVALPDRVPRKKLNRIAGGADGVYAAGFGGLLLRFAR